MSGELSTRRLYPADSSVASKREPAARTTPADRGAPRSVGPGLPEPEHRREHDNDKGSPDGVDRQVAHLHLDDSLVCAPPEDEAQRTPSPEEPGFTKSRMLAPRAASLLGLTPYSARRERCPTGRSRRPRGQRRRGRVASHPRGRSAPRRRAHSSRRGSCPGPKPVEDRTR